MNLNDPNIDSRAGRAMLDDADETLTGSYDAPDYGMLRNLVRKSFGLGDEAVKYVNTKELLVKGQKAKPDDIPPELAGLVDELNVDAPDPTDAAKLPLDPADGTNLDAQGNILPNGEQPQMQSGTLEGIEPVDLPETDKLTAEMAAKRTEELESRTWKRNVNLDYINSNRDIGSVLDTMAEYLPTAERETLASVEAGADYAGLKRYLTEKPDANLTSRQLVAGRNMLVTMGERIDELTDKLIAGDNRSENVILFEKLTGQAAMLQNFMQGQIRESARALGSMRILAKAANSADIEAISEAIGKGGAEAAIQKAKHLKELRAQGVTEAGMIQEMGGFSAAKTLSSVINLRTASMLTGVRTQVVNGVSNMGMGAWNNMLIYPMAAMISPARRAAGKAITGTAKQGVSWQENYVRSAVFMRSVRDALNMGGKVFGEGIQAGEYVSSFEGRRKVDELISDTGLVSDAVGLTKASQNDNPVIAGMAGITKRGADVYQRGVEALSYGALTASDEFFKSMAYQQGMTGYAMRTAMGEGLEGDDLMRRTNELLTEPTKDMHDWALLEAERQTFTENIEGGFIGNLNTIAKKLVQSVPVMRIVFPFINTPTSLVNRAFQISPAAVASKEFRDRIAKGGADADIALAQLTAGSSIMAAAYMMHDSGQITGRGPEDAGQRKVLESTGWQAHSIKVGDKYYSFDRMDPFSMTLGAITDAMDKAAYADRDVDATEMVAAATIGIAQQTVDSTWMRGMSDMMMVISGKKDATKYVTDVIASAIPAIVKQAGVNVLEPEQGVRQYVKYEGFWNQLSESIDAKLPIAPELPKRYWNGQMVLPGNGEAVWMYYNNLSPLPVSALKGDDLSRELVNNGVGVTPPKPVVMLKDGARIDLLNDIDNGKKIYDKMLQFVGEARATEVEKAINKRKYMKAEPGPERERAEILNKAVRDGRAKGMDRFIKWAGQQNFSEEEHGPLVKYLDKGNLKRLVRISKMQALDEVETEEAQQMRVKGSSDRAGLPTPPMPNADNQQAIEPVILMD